MRPHTQSLYSKKSIFERLHLDVPLLTGLLCILSLAMVILYSASSADIQSIERQVARIVLSFGVLCITACIPPRIYKQLAPYIYFAGLGLLILVLIVGEISKGAQRWLDLGFLRFQPSEIMKLAVPLMVANFLSTKLSPPPFWTIIVSLLIIFVPALLIVKQPDLGTGLLIIMSGCFVIFFAGIQWRYLIIGGVGAISALPLVWSVMHDYQRKRILTLLDPEKDPLGAGYHILQSKIAIGSGGFWGKGLLEGTQTHLDFLPERTTDFIFAVYSEELGYIGIIGLFLLYFFILARGLQIAKAAQEPFTRLLAGSIVMTFFIYIFINVGMVSGLLPVVGIPLPLVSYGGTALVTLMAGFGILMSIHTHRKLYSD